MKTFFKTFIALIALQLPLSLSAQVVVDDEEEPDSVEVSIEEPVVETDLPEGLLLPEDSLLNDWQTRYFLYADSTGSADQGIVYADSALIVQRLQSLPTAMEMPYNAVVRKYIDQYIEKRRRSVSYLLGAANLYVPIFEDALDALGLPLELKYLPVVESALDPTAVSRVGATGLWQFMLATGRRYGLNVNTLVDERRDPYKSTAAAARYLKDLYKIYGDWNLVLAAYNAGPGNVNKAIHRAGGSHDYWKIYPYLPRETRGYVPAFIAANYIMNFYCEHNIKPLHTRRPIQTDTLHISRNLHLQAVSELCDIEMDELRALNPSYRRDIIPGNSGNCVLVLPQDVVGRFLTQGDSVYTHKQDELLPQRAVVAVETPAPVVRKSAPSRRSKGKVKGRGGKNRSVTVRKGDTLGAIAKRNGTTVAKLRKLNGIKGNNIKSGKKIRVR